MKIRSDSAFAKLTDEQKDLLLDMADDSSLDELADWVEVEFKIETTASSLQRFLTRLRREVLVEEARAAEEGMAQLAELGKKFDFARGSAGDCAAEVAGCGGEER